MSSSSALEKQQRVVSKHVDEVSDNKYSYTRQYR